MKNSNKFLLLVVALLLVTNIVLVFLLVRGRKGHSHRSRSNSAEMIAKAVGLDDAQRTMYIEARKAHFQSLRPLYDSMQRCRAAFFATAKDSSAAADSLSDAYNRTMSDIQDDINRRTLAYIRGMRKNFTADQQRKYDSVIQRMMLRNAGRRDSTGSDR